ncbi:hypothetical protein DPEC_G00276090 [Dallia pectoralis]|uniref:Uncharacterized protein n=1 Tax=Dallia pectoralis TaxID=75939 RepID=A0ACC2FLH5_DALPE|nr:hypothetical protein DPEC_G00276090 [Dallia pectoralis]
MILLRHLPVRNRWCASVRQTGLRVYLKWGVRRHAGVPNSPEEHVVLPTLIERRDFWQPGSAPDEMQETGLVFCCNRPACFHPARLGAYWRLQVSGAGCRLSAHSSRMELIATPCSCDN